MVGPDEAGPTHYEQADEVGLLMQSAVLVMAPPIAPDRVRAAIAITEPMTARMSAYSAAEAPASSFSMLMKVFMSRSFLNNRRHPRCLRASQFSEERVQPACQPRLLRP